MALRVTHCLTGLALLWLPACAAETTPAATTETFPAAAYVTTTSDSKNLRIEVRTAPTQPPPRGTCSVELRITDSALGSPVAGLKLAVQPWMTAMGHGSAMTPVVSETGAGTYLVRNVNFSMAGDWTLRLTLTGKEVDHAAPVVHVP